MGYQMWCEAVRPSILATAWLLVFIFLLFLMCHYALILSYRGQSGKSYIFRGGPDLKSDGGPRTIALRHCCQFVSDASPRRQTTVV